MHCVVPHGYPAYARVFHPATRDRPADTSSWHGHGHGHDRSVLVDIESESVSWSAVAQTFGTSMHPSAQYHRLAGPATGTHQEVLDAEGRRYFEPPQGNLDINALASVASILCRHTSAPDNGVAAIWEGWGGLTSSAGYSQLTALPDRAGGTVTGPFAADDGPGSGILPTSVVNGPKLLVSDPAIEALQILEGADLTWDADDKNRPAT